MQTPATFGTFEGANWIQIGGFPGGVALGNVIITRPTPQMNTRDERLLSHEWGHFAQYKMLGWNVFLDGIDIFHLC